MTQQSRDPNYVPPDPARVLLKLAGYSAAAGAVIGLSAVTGAGAVALLGVGAETTAGVVVGGAVGGATGGVGLRALDDAAIRGSVSDPSLYAKDALTGGLMGVGFGLVLRAAGPIATSLSNDVKVARAIADDPTLARALADDVASATSPGAPAPAPPAPAKDLRAVEPSASAQTAVAEQACVARAVDDVASVEAAGATTPASAPGEAPPWASFLPAAEARAAQTRVRHPGLSEEARGARESGHVPMSGEDVLDIAQGPRQMEAAPPAAGPLKNGAGSLEDAARTARTFDPRAPGPTPEGARAGAAAEEGVSAQPTGQIPYGSTDLSQQAIEFARREKLGDGVNVAVFEYVDDAGALQTIARGSARGVGHSEARIARELSELGVPNDRVRRIYSDLAPCDAPGGYCARMIAEGSPGGLGPFPNARVTFAFPYGGSPHNPQAAATGVDALRAARRRGR